MMWLCLAGWCFCSSDSWLPLAFCSLLGLADSFAVALSGDWLVGEVISCLWEGATAGSKPVNSFRGPGQALAWSPCRKGSASEFSLFCSNFTSLMLS